MTRTPGTQFRKLLLYPPELRGHADLRDTPRRFYRFVLSSSWTSLRLLSFITSHDAQVCRRSETENRESWPRDRRPQKPSGCCPTSRRRSIERLERVVHCSIHRDLAPAPVLGLLEQQDAAGEVDVLPGQSEDLPSPHARVEGDRDNREQIWALTSPPFCRVAGPRFAAGWPESITSDQSPRRPRLRALPRRAPRGGPPVKSVAGDLRLRPVPHRKTRAEPPKTRRTT